MDPTQSWGCVVREVVVGRQPIFDRSAAVHGYELVCQPASGPVDAHAGAVPTVEALVTTVSVGIDRLVGGRDLYLPADAALLLHDAPIVLPPERTVLQLQADAVDGRVVERCRQLRQDGFRLAVDQRIAEQDLGGLLSLATAVKVDVSSAQLDAVEALLEDAGRRQLLTIATNIDLRQELAECDRLGFTLFQGYLLARPTILPGRTLDPGHLATLRLAATMLDAEVEIDRLEEVVRSDPALAHQLLSLAGVGAAGGMRRTVRSVREALVLVGWRRLQSWVALLLMAGSGGTTSGEEVTLALVRARACELVAQHLAPELADAAFTAGMLSTLDLMLHVELADALAGLPLDPVLSAAVLAHQGVLGAIVADVTDLQFGHFVDAHRSGVDDGTAQRALFEALTWSVQAGAALDRGRRRADAVGPA